MRVLALVMVLWYSDRQASWWRRPHNSECFGSLKVIGDVSAQIALNHNLLINDVIANQTQLLFVKVHRSAIRVIPVAARIWARVGPTP